MSAGKMILGLPFGGKYPFKNKTFRVKADVKPLAVIVATEGLPSIRSHTGKPSSDVIT